MVKSTESCPCGEALRYDEHCEIVHLRGAGLGAKAEDLMRARYSAYVMHMREFLLNSWHSTTRPDQLEFDPSIKWHGLTILDTQAGGALDSTGMVEFLARFERGGEPLELHERSSFERVNGQWFYVDAE